MIYTDDQWLIIKKASPHYESAKKGYIRNVPSWLVEGIVKTYESATGKNMLYKDFTCATCVLHIMNLIGKTYFSDLAERNKLQEEKKNVVRDEKSKRRNQKKTKGDS